MSVQPDLSVLEVLDFTPELPCEHGEHSELHEPNDPAAYLVRYRCPSCAEGAVDFALCASGWVVFGARGCRCKRCGARGIRRDTCMTIVRRINDDAA